MSVSQTPRSPRGFRRQQQSRPSPGTDPHAHGWWRRGEDVQGRMVAPPNRHEPDVHGATLWSRSLRRATGLPFVMVLLLAMVTAFGLVQVRNRLHLLELAQSIGEITADYDRLRDRKEQLEAERAFLAHPAKIRREAQNRLGMRMTAPEQIQQIKIKAKTKAKPTSSTIANAGVLQP